NDPVEVVEIRSACELIEQRKLCAARCSHRMRSECGSRAVESPKADFPRRIACLSDNWSEVWRVAFAVDREQQDGSGTVHLRRPTPSAYGCDRHTSERCGHKRVGEVPDPPRIFPDAPIRQRPP